MEEIYRLTDYWQRVPPLRDLVAAIASVLGVKFERASTGVEVSEASTEGLIPDEFEE